MKCSKIVVFWNTSIHIKYVCIGRLPQRLNARAAIPLQSQFFTENICPILLACDLQNS